MDGLARYIESSTWPGAATKSHRLGLIFSPQDAKGIVRFVPLESSIIDQSSTAPYPPHQLTTKHKKQEKGKSFPVAAHHSSSSAGPEKPEAVL